MSVSSRRLATMATERGSADGRRHARAHRRSLRTAILYSGRFYGSLTPDWYENHLEHVIRPNNATVFIVSDFDNWCHAPEDARSAIANGKYDQASAIFVREVHSAFAGWRQVHGRLAVAPFDKNGSVPWLSIVSMYHAAAALVPVRASAFWTTLIGKWYNQFLHYRHADDLRQGFGPHDVVLRLRLDVLFNEKALVTLLQLSDTVVFGTPLWVRWNNKTDYMGKQCDQMENRTQWWLRQETLGSAEPFPEPFPVSPGTAPCTLHWDDKEFAGTEASMAVLSQMTETMGKFARRRVPRANRTHLFDRDRRCFGLCPEEQTTLHLLYKGIKLEALPLSWRTEMVRVQRNVTRTPATNDRSTINGGNVCSSGSGKRLVGKSTLYTHIRTSRSYY